ncbi:MAG: HPF/RaiA family ribosome-associated protein [Planctomycetes bacterium]|nr:HPF/RaiA family ribosome-associated protein [Planctomycetota bacterium]
MNFLLEIAARDFDLTDANKADIDKYAEKLDTAYDRIIRCRVVVEALRHREHRGLLYNVKIVVTIPGTELVIKRKPNEDFHMAVKDSFNAMRRKLEDFVAQRRGKVKHHEEVPLARISNLFTEEGYGFITSSDGREIYFHRNSVLNHDFTRLEKGMEVRFVEEEGDKGPQASSVTVTGG